MCASELSIVNADYSSTSFRLSRTSIPAHSFLGNLITYPSQGKVGENCLLATKVLVPIGGKVREGVGLLGSPSFEIPRTVERDNRFNHLTHGEERRRRLAAKNRHNAVSIGMLLLARWTLTLGLLLIGYVTVDLYPTLGVAAVAAGLVLTLLFSIAHAVFVERASLRFGRHADEVLLDLPEGLLAHRALLQDDRAPVAPHDVRRHPLQGRALAAGGRPRRQAGSTTTAAACPRRTW